MLDLRTLSQRLGVSKRRLHQLIAEGRLEARKLGGAYLVTEAEAQRFEHLPRPPGRPPRPPDSDPVPAEDPESERDGG